MRGHYAVVRPRPTEVVDDIAFEQPRSDDGIGNGEAVAEAVPATSDTAPAAERAPDAPPAESVSPERRRGEEIPRYGWFG